MENEMLVMDGFDDCIEGVVERFGMNPIVCYNKQKVLDKLISEAGCSCTLDEAKEYYEFNQLGAWMGEGTPCFIDTDAWDQIYPELDELNKDL